MAAGGDSHNNPRKELAAKLTGMCAEERGDLYLELDHL